MRKSLALSIMFGLIFFFASANEAYSQRRGTKKRPTERDRTERSERDDRRNAFQSLPFKDRLWYGGNLGLGFGSSQFRSDFNINIAPMVGYKITPNWSAGPRLDLGYFDTRFNFGTRVDRYNSFVFGGGVFTRYKVIWDVFIHVESGFFEFPLLGTDLSGNPTVFKQVQNPVYVGLGYNAGGGEILLLYDVAAPGNAIVQPWDLRFGFTFNF